MNLIVRRVSFVIIIVIFLIIAPLILLYAIGYRYDFLRKEVVRVGVLYVRSIPENAIIYLNSRVTNKKTPARLTSLLPNEYQLEVKKEGYFTYQKKITIYPETATNLKNIILFKENSLVKEIVSEDIKQIKLSPSQDKIAYLIESNNSSKLWIYDLNSEEKKLMYESGALNPIDNFSWSTNSSQIFIRQKNNFLLINIDNNDKIDLNKYRLNINDIKWDPDNDRIIYSLINSAIYQINLIDDKITLILKENIVDFTVKNKIIYYINKESNVLKFKYYDLNKNITDEIFNLKQSEQFIILNDSSKFIILTDQNNQDLYLIDTSIAPPAYEKLDVQAKSVQFTADHKKLLYYNDFEIGYFDLEKGGNNLITRTSNQIRKALWHALAQNVIYLEGNNLKIMELTGPVRNVFDLRQSNIADFYIDKNGKNLYLLLSKKNQKLFYKLNIQ